jgi:glutaredoxin 3
VLVFSKSTCPFCARVHSALDSLNLKPPAEIVLLDHQTDGSQIQRLLHKLTDQRTVPNVFVGGQHVGGCDDTMAALANGSLSKLLATAGVQVGSSSKL